MKLSKQWLVDTAERVVGTFLEAFVATLVVSASGVSLTAVKTAALAGLASALTLVKSLVGAYVGNPDSASVIPSVGAPSAVQPGAIPPAITTVSQPHVVFDWDPETRSLVEELKPASATAPPATPVSAPSTGNPTTSPRPMWPTVNLGTTTAPPPAAHPGAVPADRVTPLYPSPQQP